METWCKGTGMGFTIYAEVMPDGTLYSGVGHGTYKVISDDEASCPAGQNRCILGDTSFPLLFSDYIVKYNGTDWSTVELPEYPQYTGSDAVTFSMGIWIAEDGGIYTSAAASNTEEDIFKWLIGHDSGPVTSEIIFWDGTGWTPLTTQPDSNISFIHGTQKGDLYGTDIHTSLISHYQSCNF
jgi:hypothetical protein